MAGGRARARRRRGERARLLPVDSEHSALAQCLEGAGSGRRDGDRHHRLGWPVSRPPPRRARRRHRGRRARPPDVEHGREDHDRLGHPDEQGPRGDRGASPVRRRPTTPIEVVVHPAVDRPRDGALPRRRPARARRPPRHARADLVGADPSASRADDGRGRSTSPRRSAWTSSRPTSRPSAASPSPARRAWPAAPRPCVLNAANEVAVRAFLDGRIGFLDIAARRRGGARPGLARARRRRSSRCSTPTAARASRPQPAQGSRPHERLHRHRRPAPARRRARARPFHRGEG